jgi:hypothetical protein
MFVVLTCFYSCQRDKVEQPIDRYALVSRHNVVLHVPDTLGSLSVGNGEFAFTTDVSGLQTFYNEYENGISLGTQAQWGWHSSPSDERFSLRDVTQEFESCDGTKVPYAIQHDEGRGGEATRYLRANPHRLHLGLIGLTLLKKDGSEVTLEDLSNITQQLDLWTGKIESEYEIEGVPVRVVVYGHQQQDAIAVRIQSPLIGLHRLGVRFNFPYGNECHVCPGYDLSNFTKHQTDIVSKEVNRAVVRHSLDTTTYFTHVQWNGAGEFQESERHHFNLQPDSSDVFEFSVLFNTDPEVLPSDFATTKQSSEDGWNAFWSSGGAVDFSGSTDPRADELERRVVLSQYLTKIQCAGSMPPQETGLTMNSWYGKFHLEMHWWHAAQFALWGRAELLEKSLVWYSDALIKARQTASWQGYAGARWQKMTDPYGAESPSNVGAFIIWQQPHPIYLAELLYRESPNQSTLQKYKDLVFYTAEFMSSFVKEQSDTFHLCHPLIPAQEIFPAETTDDPAFELQYWYYSLTIAQQWRRRLGMDEDAHWNDVIKKLTPLPMAAADNLYLPNATTPLAYEDDQFRRDHPAVVGAYGLLPFNARMDTVVMANTFKNILGHWQWDTTWGWDYPLLAMTAARLNQPNAAIKALMMNVQKNTYLPNGHNFQNERLRLYLPGNGGLLAAVAMMAAGWDGNKKTNPGFPTDGTWRVRWEGLRKMP